MGLHGLLYHFYLDECIYKVFKGNVTIEGNQTYIRIYKKKQIGACQRGQLEQNSNENRNISTLTLQKKM
jgi:hypothetical protein